MIPQIHDPKDRRMLKDVGRNVDFGAFLKYQRELMRDELEDANDDEVRGACKFATWLLEQISQETG